MFLTIYITSVIFGSFIILKMFEKIKEIVKTIRIEKERKKKGMEIYEKDNCVITD